MHCWIAVKIFASWKPNLVQSIEIINNTRGGIVVKFGERAIGGQNQVPDVRDNMQASQAASYGFEVISNNFFSRRLLCFYLQESR